MGERAPGRRGGGHIFAIAGGLLILALLMLLPDLGPATSADSAITLHHGPFRNTLTSLVTGTTGSHQRAAAEAILQVQLRLPDPSRAAQFERLVGPMLDRIAVARQESRTLVALRNALLPRLLSGEKSPSFGGGRWRMSTPAISTVELRASGARVV